MLAMDLSVGVRECVGSVHVHNLRRVNTALAFVIPKVHKGVFSPLHPN